LELSKEFRENAAACLKLSQEANSIEAQGYWVAMETYDNGSKKLRARFFSKLKILAHLSRDEWHDVYFKNLSGPCDGLSELRFKADGVQQRPLGFHLTSTEFVILFWATEKGGRFVPLSACEKALARKLEILTGTSKAHAIWLALE
jgi:hypothetical protein